MSTITVPGASATSTSGEREAGARRKSPFRHLTEALVAVAVVAGAVTGIRLLAASSPGKAPAPHLVSSPAGFPTNPAIEQAWGIRFTNVVLLADGGIVELRYQIVNPATAGRIHSGAQSDAQLPVVKNEKTGSEIKPSAVMLHFHHGDQTSDGRTYSIIYGNAGNTVRAGDPISIVMADKMTLAHFPATN